MDPQPTPPPAWLYEYRAKVTEVYDGDTITCDIDLGFGVWKHSEKIRLFGIDSPEVRGATREAGLRTRDELRRRILGRDVLIRTHKDEREKYGRYLAEVLVWNGQARDWRNVNEELVTEGLAVPAEW